jgi:glutamine amidotransferase PdxT
MCSLWIERSQIVRGAEDSMVQFMDLSVTNNAWGRRQYGTVYGSIGHKKYVGQKTIWYSLWICWSQKIRGAEDNMVPFMDLSVTNNAWHRIQYGTVYGSVGHKQDVG